MLVLENCSPLLFRLYLKEKTKSHHAREHEQGHFVDITLSISVLTNGLLVMGNGTLVTKLIRVVAFCATVFLLKYLAAKLIPDVPNEILIMRDTHNALNTVLVKSKYKENREKCVSLLQTEGWCAENKNSRRSCLTQFQSISNAIIIRFLSITSDNPTWDNDTNEQILVEDVDFSNLSHKEQMAKEARKAARRP